MLVYFVPLCKAQFNNNISYILVIFNIIWNYHLVFFISLKCIVYMYSSQLFYAELIQHSFGWLMSEYVVQQHRLAFPLGYGCYGSQKPKRPHSWLWRNTTIIIRSSVGLTFNIWETRWSTLLHELQDHFHQNTLQIVVAEKKRIPKATNSHKPWWLTGSCMSVCKINVDIQWDYFII